MRPRPFLLRGGGGRHSIELNSEADLAGLQVGVVSGSSYEMELSSRDDISLQRFNSEGELERAGRPFSRNIRIDEFDNFKESHRKRAQTYNASYVSCTDDYTAYIIDGGKTVCVFYYNTTGMEAAA